MSVILSKAVAFLLIILLGQGLKRIGLFGPHDYQILSKIVMNLTLPASVITAFAAYQHDASFIAAFGIGLGCNLLLILLGLFLSRGKSGGERAYFICNLAGYNIGCFTMPFVQSFLGANGVIAACMFDTGNSIMCTGGTYAIAAYFSCEKEHHPSLGQSLKKLFSSIPFDTYLLMLLLALAGVHLPQDIYTITSTIGSANGFLSMFMIGMMLQIKPERSYFKRAGFTLLLRYLSAVLFGAVFFLCTPFPLEVRQVLLIACFAPISLLAPVFTERCGGDGQLAGFVNSLSIVISILCITLLLFILQIG